MGGIICPALGASLVICESSLFSFLPVEFAKPDISVPFIIYGTFFLSPLGGLLAAALFGFIQEAPPTARPAPCCLRTSASCFPAFL